MDQSMDRILVKADDVIRKLKEKALKRYELREHLKKRENSNLKERPGKYRTLARACFIAIRVAEEGKNKYQ